MDLNINNLKQNQIRSLFSHAYISNISIFIGSLLIIAAFNIANENGYIGWFFTILIFSLCSRVLIAYIAQNTKEDDLTKYAHYYVLFSFIIGLDYSYLYLITYNLEHNELRSLLTVICFGLMTASVGSLSVWIKAYLAFVIPQAVALFVYFYLHDGVLVALAIIMFFIFIVKVALNFNVKYKQEYRLLSDNMKLISKMENEIFTRKEVQKELEQNKFELEDKVKERTVDLEKSNNSLDEQIGKRRVFEKELEYIAYYDTLTNLPNRNLFVEDVTRAIIQAKRTETLMGVLFIDLDRFKNINDSYGHHIGDELLKSVANRLSEELRDSDIIARNGGDEFSILIENMLDAREPFVVAEKIIKCLNERFIIKHHNVHIGASIGISMYPLDSNEALELISMADTAMYESKKVGSNKFQFYSSAMSNQIADRLMLENALRDALSNDEFYLVYQPQIDINTQTTIGFEALIRWNSPVFGIVPPFKFISILENTGLIYAVGEWVILKVIDFIKLGKSHGKKVSINLSALQCGVSNYSDKIKSFILDALIDPKLVEFEITETLLIDDFSQTEMFLTDISNIGCTVALDDFGTGYTSFSYLSKLPIDVIKIDRSFVTDIHLKPELKNIVLAIVTMSQSLDIKNVFEGVETTKELDVIKELGGSVIQGYLFSKPIEETDINVWFEQEKAINSI